MMLMSWWCGQAGLRGSITCLSVGEFGSGGSRSRMMGKLEERAGIKEDSGASSSWAPDPVTGYYKPIYHATVIDAVELRKLLAVGL